jgi:hypothetical protein
MRGTVLKEADTNRRKGPNKGILKSERKVERCVESRKRRKLVILWEAGWEAKNQRERGALGHRKPWRGTEENCSSRS